MEFSPSTTGSASPVAKVMAACSALSAPVNTCYPKSEIPNPKSQIELPQLLIHKSKDRGRDADDDEGRDRSPNGIGFSEFPDREDAQNGARDERHRDDDECDPADDRGINDTARLGL